MATLVPLARPSLTALEESAVLTVLRSGRLSMGEQLTQFEHSFRTYLGLPQAVAVSSGTAGLHLVVRGLGLAPGDEVITTPFSFIASASCLLFEGVKPVFVDAEPQTGNIDPRLIPAAITPRTKAVLAVHVFGCPADMAAVRKVADKHHLFVIEDACEALGAAACGQAAGTLGDAGVFAFYPNKQITTGEGGMIVTRRTELADFCRAARNQGRTPGCAWLEHHILGYNYRLDELSAALGCVQMSRLPDILAKRAEAAARYESLLAGTPEVSLPGAAPYAQPSWFVYVLRFGSRYWRDTVGAALTRQGIECKPYFPSIHLQPLFAQRFGYTPGAYPRSERLSDTSLAVPFFTDITAAEQELVAQAISTAIKEGRGAA